MRNPVSLMRIKYESQWDFSDIIIGGLLWLIVAVMVFGCGYVIYDSCAASEPTGDYSVKRGMPFEVYNHKDHYHVKIHLGGMKKESRTSSSPVTTVGYKGQVSVGISTHSYEVNVPNIDDLWTKDLAIVRELNSAVQNERRVTVRCRAWNHNGGVEIISIEPDSK